MDTLSPLKSGEASGKTSNLSSLSLAGGSGALKHFLLSVGDLIRYLPAFPSHLHFFCSSQHVIVKFHKEIALTAVIPLLHNVFLLAPMSYTDFGSIYKNYVAFISLFAVCYSMYIIRTNLLPRSKTFKQWNAYMEWIHADLNHHIREVLSAYHRQTVGVAEKSTPYLDESSIYILRPDSAFQDEEVMTKYVNFCWRFSYRLWCKDRNTPGKLSTSQETHNASDISSLPPQMQEFLNSSLQGDTRTADDNGKFPMGSSQNDTNFNVLLSLAQRVNRFSEGKRE